MKKRKIDDEEHHKSRMETASIEHENAKIQQQILLEELNLKKKRTSMYTYIFMVLHMFSKDT